LIAKSTAEIRTGRAAHDSQRRQIEPLRRVVRQGDAQIMLLDIVFSLDSVITAVGMAKDILITAVMISVVI
jgi:predicted tellurium resistance membrane protein TerC